MKATTIILDHNQIHQKIKRIAYQIYEANSFEDEIIIAGIQGNGVYFAQQLAKSLQQISSLKVILCEVFIDKKKPFPTKLHAALSLLRRVSQFTFSANRCEENKENTNIYEIELNVNVNASHVENQVYLVDLKYIGIFEIENLTDDIREAYLLVECPRQLFPFARRIIYDLHSDGSLPPLLLDPVNFADLYQKKKSIN